jgi:hypothetical protein
VSDSGSAEQDLAREREQRDESFAAPPVSERLRQAADAIVELNSMSGYTPDAAQRAGVSAMFLRHEADVMEEK